MTQTSLCDVPYTGSAIWLLVYTAIIAISVIGNTLTITAILTSRKLQNLLSNRFVLSLAVSDLLVGCSVPYHMVPHYWPEINRTRTPCLLRFSLIAFACASSIYNLLLVSADRYVAIVHPLHYSRCMTRRVSLVLISAVWAIALGIGSCLLYWNHWDENGGVCDISLAPQAYLNYLLAPFFLVVWIVMIAFYIRIVKEAKEHAKRLKHAASVSSLPGLYEPSKSLQMVFVILGCFTVTWFPYFLCITIIKTKGKFCLLFYEISFWMAVGNSAMNPLIYAWKNHGFRQAFRYLLACRSPDSAHVDYITNHVPSGKAGSLHGVERGIGGDAGGYCNGGVDDLVRSERAASLAGGRAESDLDSEHTVVSELSVAGLCGAAAERSCCDGASYVERL